MVYHLTQQTYGSMVRQFAVSPSSMYLFASSPTGVALAICERRISPLERWVMLKVVAIREDIVPFPAPGGPMITARNNRDTPIAAKR